jgi:hypothetical protein
MDKEKQHAEKISQEAKETYNKLLHLYERFATETTIICKQGESLGKIIEELKAESSLATEFKIQVRKGITEHTKTILEEIDRLVEKSVQKSVTGEANKLLQELKETTNAVTEILQEYAVDKKIRNVWIYCGVIFCALIAISCLYTVTRVHNCSPYSYLTTDQISTYSSGRRCNTIWSRLSKKTQDWLLSIEKGKTQPEENSYDWIQERNPKLSAKEIKKKFDELDK